MKKGVIIISNNNNKQTTIIIMLSQYYTLNTTQNTHTYTHTIPFEKDEHTIYKLLH